MMSKVRTRSSRVSRGRPGRRPRKRARQKGSRRRRSLKRSFLGVDRRRLTLLASRSLRVCGLVALPLVLLVHGAVAAHTHLGAPGWISVLVGVLLGALALGIVGSRAWARLTGRDRRREITLAFALPVTVGLTIYSVAWLSHANAKSPEIVTRWGELHPALRMGIGTARLADDDLLVTEIGRGNADYDRMGLSRPRRSMHYRQTDGWVHAVDLRTIGRSEMRNRIGQLYFELMGFETLRHVGTADHLHVALPSR